jgi:N6-L-threonylcarbamoyladenine synthase
VGVETAKTIALVHNKPIIPVNHVLAHMYANFIVSSQENSIDYPVISLVVSGGHTELFLMNSPEEIQWLGGTIDDAAGEAFDKSARLMGFGNGGGPAIQQAASQASSDIVKNMIRLPRPMLDADNNYFNFSFSGLKTAIWREWNKHEAPSQDISNAFAYEVQETITDILIKKTMRAIEKHNAKSVLLSGGVAANLKLREKFQSTINNYNEHLKLFIPPVALCTDNAAYIASYAYFRGKPEVWDSITAMPDLEVEVNM